MGTAVVTGAAGGVGRALAEQLAGEGHRVHLADVGPLLALPDEWRPAFHTRNQRLLCGTVPTVPTPDPTPNDWSSS